MNDSQELAADLMKVWKAGDITFPLAANQFAFASYHLKATESKEDAFYGERGVRTNLAEVLPGEGFGPAHPYWAELRDLAGDLLARAAEDYHNVGRALVHVSDEYAETDTDAAEDLDRRKAEFLDNDEIDKEPPPRRYIPDVADPDSIDPEEG